MEVIIISGITRIDGGVCAPAGFVAGGMHCGIAKNPEKKDLAVIYSIQRAACAAVYTQNKVKAAPIQVTKENLRDGYARAVICNSGNANACNADGYAVARRMCSSLAAALEIAADDIVVASTGVIGQSLKVSLIESAVPKLVQRIDEHSGRKALQAIMTTDVAEKEIAVSFEIGGVTCKMGAIAKGSGMIHPNMATMLGFITTDADIEPEMLGKAIATVARDTFNMVSVDGDTSTNDMAVVLANGLSGAPMISAEGEDYDSFVRALMYVCIYLARGIAGDGEGATKLLECAVSGAPDDECARVLAKSVITSSLFKAAMFGADANWGRVLCALGYAPANFDISKTQVTFASSAGEIEVCRDGAGVAFSEETAKKILSEAEIEINIALAQGPGSAVAWGCDLTYDYVKINGDYRS